MLSFDFLLAAQHIPYATPYSNSVPKLLLAVLVKHSFYQIVTAIKKLFGLTPA